MTHFRPIRPDSALVALAAFLTERAEQLLNAAGLLGDAPAIKRTARLIEDVAAARVVTNRMRRELVALHRLLSLDGVDDLDSMEAACFAEIDPALPVVEELCLLTDAYRERLQALADEEGRPAIWDFADAA